MFHQLFKQTRAVFIGHYIGWPDILRICEISAFLKERLYFTIWNLHLLTLNI